MKNKFKKCKQTFQKRNAARCLKEVSLFLSVVREKEMICLGVFCWQSSCGTENLLEKLFGCVTNENFDGLILHNGSRAPL